MWLYKALSTPHVLNDPLKAQLRVTFFGKNGVDHRPQLWHWIRRSFRGQHTAKSSTYDKHAPASALTHHRLPRWAHDSESTKFWRDTLARSFGILIDQLPHWTKMNRKRKVSSICIAACELLFSLPSLVTCVSSNFVSKLMRVVLRGLG